MKNSNEPKTPCPECGTLKPQKFSLCWKCWAKQPANTFKRFKNKKIEKVAEDYRKIQHIETDTYASEKEYQEIAGII